MGTVLIWQFQICNVSQICISIIVAIIIIVPLLTFLSLMLVKIIIMIICYIKPFGWRHETFLQILWNLVPKRVFFYFGSLNTNLESIFKNSKQPLQYRDSKFRNIMKLELFGIVQYEFYKKYQFIRFLKFWSPYCIRFFELCHYDNNFVCSHPIKILLPNFIGIHQFIKVFEISDCHIG